MNKYETFLWREAVFKQQARGWKLYFRAKQKNEDYILKNSGLEQPPHSSK